MPLNSGANLLLHSLICKKGESMSTKFSKHLDKREKPTVGKLTVSEEAVRNSPFIINKIEQAKRRLKEHPFPIALLGTK
jgi:N-glycosylase/DNA lyase